jgi:hypothetical protein
MGQTTQNGMASFVFSTSASQMVRVIDLARNEEMQSVRNRMA